MTEPRHNIDDLDGLLGLVVAAVVAEMKSTHGAESGQEQRRREDRTIEDRQDEVYVSP